MNDIVRNDAPLVETPPQIAATPAQISALQTAEQDAISGKGASGHIWVVIYILLVAGLTVGFYLLTQYVSFHNTAAQSILIPIALYVAGLFTPAGKIASAAAGK